MKQRHTVIPAVFVILRKDGSVLLLRRYQTGWRDGEYTFPAGHLDGKESLIQAAIREAKEEVGVEIAASDLELVHVSHRPSDDEPGVERIDFYFETDTWQGEPVNAEPHKADQLRWVHKDEDMADAVPSVQAALSALREGKVYFDENFDSE